MKVGTEQYYSVERRKEVAASTSRMVSLVKWLTDHSNQTNQNVKEKRF